MTISYSARLSPWQAETVWTLDAGELVERRGGREKRFALTELVSLRASATGIVLRFRRRRQLQAPSMSYGGLRPVDQAASFAPFLAALMAAVQADAPRARMLASLAPLGEPVIWTMALMGAGAVALLVSAAGMGAWTLGVTLAARLVFVLILAGAILPWLDRARR